MMGDAYVLAHFLDYVSKAPSASLAAVEKHLSAVCSGYRHQETLSKHLRVVRSFIEEHNNDLKNASVLRAIFQEYFYNGVRNRLDWSRPSEFDTIRESEGSQKKIKPAVAASSGLLLEDSRLVSRNRVSRPKGGKKTSRQPTPQTEIGDDPPVCVICDDGGDLLSCDGPCSRNFHAFPGTGKESFCSTLGLSREKTKEVERWYCKNCEHKQYQCFICGELGSTDPVHGLPEIFRCELKSCKRFYHLRCVTQLVDFPNSASNEKQILNGTQRLVCPRHKCDTCRLTDRTPGKLVQCRRCPKAWHKKCLTNYSLSREFPTTIIWNHHQHEFVYCRHHKVNPTLLTPTRDHLRFPKVVENKKRKTSLNSSGLNGTTAERKIILPPTSLAAEIGLLNQDSVLIGEMSSVCTDSR